MESYVLNANIGGKWIGIPVMRGNDGDSVSLRVQDNRLQWKYGSEDDAQWRDLFDFSTIQTIKGDKGDPGDPGSPGSPGYTPVRGTDYWTA